MASSHILAEDLQKSSYTAPNKECKLFTKLLIHVAATTSGFTKWKQKNQDIAKTQLKSDDSPKRALKTGAERSKNQIEEEMMREMMRIQQEADGFEISNGDNQMLMLPQLITIAKKQNSSGGSKAVTPNTGGDSRQSTLSH